MLQLEWIQNKEHKPVQTLPTCVPLETDPLPLCWIPGEVWELKEQFSYITPPLIITQGEKSYSLFWSALKKLNIWHSSCSLVYACARHVLNIKEYLSSLMGTFFSPQRNIIGEARLMSHWEGFWTPSIGYARTLLNQLSVTQATSPGIFTSKCKNNM